MNEDIDVGIRSLLVTLDPERTDPGYWHRFHRWVVTSAVGELAKRRRREATVSEVMFSWWRTVVPIAAVAAALAWFVLVQALAEPSAAVPMPDMTMDELLREGMEAPVMPSFESADPGGAIVVVNEVY